MPHAHDILGAFPWPALCFVIAGFAWTGSVYSTDPPSPQSLLVSMLEDGEACTYQEAPLEARVSAQLRASDSLGLVLGFIVLV